MMENMLQQQQQHEVDRNAKNSHRHFTHQNTKSKWITNKSQSVKSEFLILIL